MQKKLHMRIHPLGYKIIAITVLLLTSVNVLLWILLPIALYWLLVFIIPSLVLLVLVIRFFRYPSRTPLHIEDNVVVAPADGLIVTIENVDNDRFMKAPGIQISIFMSPYNVHLNWVPIDGTAEEVTYLPGKYLLARNPKSSMLNEMVCAVFKNQYGKTIVVKQIAGIVARRIIPFLKSGDVCKKGDELGFIRFGSRVDVILPVGSEVLVKIGDKTKGLETAIARLI